MSKQQQVDPLYRAAAQYLRRLSGSDAMAASLVAGAEWALLVYEADPILGQALLAAIRNPNESRCQGMLSSCLPTLRAAMAQARTR